MVYKLINHLGLEARNGGTARLRQKDYRCEANLGYMLNKREEKERGKEEGGGWEGKRQGGKGSRS